MDLLLAVIGANDSAFSAFLSAEADGLDTPSAPDAGAEAMAILTESNSWMARQARREVIREMCREVAA